MATEDGPGGTAPRSLSPARKGLEKIDGIRPAGINHDIALGRFLDAPLSIEEARALRREQDSEARPELAPQWIPTLEIPARYRAAALESFELHGDAKDQETQIRVLRSSEKWLEIFPGRADPFAGFPQIVAFRGGHGTGKGHIAWSLAKIVHFTYRLPVIVARAQDLIRDIRSAWGTPDELPRVAKYRAPALLVIDECARDRLQSEPAKHLDDVLIARDEDLRPSILITTDAEKEFRAMIGGAVNDRLEGSSRIWQFGTRSYRPNLRRAK